MAGIHITRFGGMRPIEDARQLRASEAQVAHNCLLSDGSLRSIPAWVTLATGVNSVMPGHGNTLYTPCPGFSGLDFLGPPFGKQQVFVDGGGNLNPNLSGVSASGTLTVTASGLSKKAVNRVYGVTTVYNYGGVELESAMFVCAGSNAMGLMYEGDAARVVMSGTGSKVRLYRSTSDVTSGAGANGAVTANWQLVAEIEGSSGTYVDAGAAVANPFDAYVYRGSLKQPFTAHRMGLLESGWVWMVSDAGQVALSDRFSWVFWPVENVYSLGDDGAGAILVTGACSVGDVLYIGTTEQIFVGTARATDTGGVVMQLLPIPSAEGCLPNTMVATPTGAVYTSISGVVAVNGNEARLLTRDIARGLIDVLPDGTELTFSMMRTAFYHHGAYYAFAEAQQLIGGTHPTYGFRFVAADALSPANDAGTLVSMEAPANQSNAGYGTSYVNSIRGACVVFGASSGGGEANVYTLPLPEDAGLATYVAEAKQRYVWRSKKFVFTGNVEMGAAKVVHDCAGNGVRLRLYVDCCCVYETVVRGCVPFTLPDQLRGITWEIELQGCSRVTEVHLAPTIRELTDRE